MLLNRLDQKGLIHPPKFLIPNTHFLTMMGSVAYGVSSDTSDVDVYGFCIPSKEQVFPHLAGEVPGFGTQKQRFDVWQEHHIKDAEAGKEYDFSVYSIVKFFALVMENNPNMVDALFVPRRCILHSTDIAEMVREKRKMFLHKGSFHKFRGYAYRQMSKIKEKRNSSNPKRAADVATFGFDLKFAYHVLRLALECEQLLMTGDLDLERDREILKSVRRGEWTLEQIEAWFTEKERHLEGLYANSTLPHGPDEAAIKQLLLDCLEHHYGSLENAVTRDVSAERVLGDLRELLARYGG